jgi:hypothetical protein
MNAGTLLIAAKQNVKRLPAYGEGSEAQGATLR